MKLLFDQNLSHHLVGRLADLYPASLHVRQLGLDRATDGEVWHRAKRDGFCIVTHDGDFAERSRLYGSPPKVVWLRCGNATTDQIEAILRRHAPLVAELALDAALDHVEIA